MEQRIFELLHRCTVRISVPGKTGHGSGFFVAPGLILTCAHVLKAAQLDPSPITAFWNGQSYPAQITKLQHEYDLALLQVPLGDHPCVYLHEEAIPFDALYSYGYPDDHPDGDPATFTLEGKAGAQGNQIKFKTGQVRPGLSGAPLLNVRTGYVCGVMQLTRDRNNDLGGRAIPITNILRVFPELISQQQQFHQQDGRWTNCFWEVVARTRYLESMIRLYGSITLPIGPAQGFSLQAIFQPLKLRRDPLAAEDLVRDERRALLGEPRYRDDNPRRAFPESRRSGDQVRQSLPPVIAENADDALKKSSKRSMVILGGPGTGKTTLLEYLVGDRAQKARIDPTAPLPVFILLPDLARSGKTLKEYLLSIIQDMMIDERYTQILWKAIEQGRAFVCLDSLDEVAPKLRPDKIRLINEWASSTNSTYIIGSRFTDYKGGQLRSERFTEWELQPMTPALRLELAKRLLPELYRLMPPKQIPAESSTFVSALERHEQAAAWSENPLLFSLAALVFVRTGALPHSRIMLYQQVIDAVLETREPDRSRRELLRSVLTCLALELYQEKGRTFTQGDLLRYLRTVRRQQDEQWDTEEIMQRILNSGILEVVAHDTYGFRHQTFQEYLAGVELARRLTSESMNVREGAWTLAWGKRMYSRWTEVLRLMVGALMQMPEQRAKTQVKRWFSGLLELQTTPGGDIGNLGLLLALKSVGEVATTEEWEMMNAISLEVKIVSIYFKQLFEYARRNHTGMKRLQDALRGELSHLSRDGQKVATLQLVVNSRSHNQNVRTIAIELMGVQGGQVLLEPLLIALQNKKRNVRWAAVQALGALGEHVPLEMLLVALQDKDPLIRVEAVQVLATQGGWVPLEPLLKALQDEDWSVRKAAVQTLGTLGERVPLEPLLAALQDEDRSVREAVVQVLASQSERMPWAPLFTALRDEDLEVIKAVVQALGASGEQVPLELLIEALQDEDEHVRAAAVEVLAMQGKRVTITPLLAALQDECLDVRVAAVQALGTLGEQVPLELLIEALRDEDGNLQASAVQALGALGERAPLELLTEALQDEDWSLREAAVKALATQGERVPLEVLTGALHDLQSFVQVATVQTLGALGERVPLELFIEGLQKEEDDVFEATIEVLRAQKERVEVGLFAHTLKNEYRVIRRAALEVLLAQGERVPPEPLVEALHYEDWSIREAAVQALGGMGERVPLELLIEVLQDEDGLVRRAAVQTLAIQGKRVSLDLLIEAFQDEDGRVRRVALEALATRGERVPLELLIKALQEALYDEDWRVRKAAVQALGTLGEQAPHELLIEAFQDEDERVRWEVVYILGVLGECMPLNLLIEIFQEAFQDEDVSVRAEALEAIGQHLPVELLIEALQEALQDEDWWVSEAAREVLTTQGKRLPLELLTEALQDEDWSLREAAVKALATQGERVPLEVLTGALHDRSWRVRAAAVQALGALGERVPSELLIEILQDENGDVRAAAVQILGMFGERVPFDLFKEALQDEDWVVKVAAAQALKAQVERVSLDPLIEAIHDEDWIVREAAMQALEELGARVPTELLIEALLDEDMYVRRGAMEALATQGRLVPTELLIEALLDKDEGVRAAAMQALAISGEPVPHEPLVASLGDEDVRVRSSAAQVLHRVAPEALASIIPEAIAILRKEGSGEILGSLIQGHIADIIGQLGYAAPDLLEKVTELLDWPHWQVRLKAIRALGALRRNIPDKAIRLLLEIRSDQDLHSRVLREAADEALAEILSLESGIEDD